MIVVIITISTCIFMMLSAIDIIENFFKKEKKGEEMNLKELAKQAIENSETLDTSNEAKKRTAVAYINRELIESRQHTFETLPTQEIDETIEEVLHGSK